MNNTLVCIDASYCIYHAIFRTMRMWESRNKSEAKLYLTPSSDGMQHDLLQSDSFKESLQMSVMHTCYRINDIVEQHLPQFQGIDVRSYATQLLVFDDKTVNGFRRKLYPEYKMSRAAGKAILPYDLYKVINYVYNILLDHLDVYGKMGYIKTGVYGAEADDIIYTAITEYDDKFENKLIISSDHDLLQIPNVVQYNLENKLVKRTDRHGNLMSCKDYLLRKIITGDGSDNISAICSRCGIAKAEKFIANPDILKEFLVENQEAAKQFALNKSLIDISKMPAELSNAIKEELSKLISLDTNNITINISNVDFDCASIFGEPL